jgi:hypothetical protein
MVDGGGGSVLQYRGSEEKVRGKTNQSKKARGWRSPKRGGCGGGFISGGASVNLCGWSRVLQLRGREDKVRCGTIWVKAVCWCLSP